MADILHTEEEYIFDKTHTCPVCSQTFRAKVMKTGKARMVNQDMDTRPRFEYVDPIKYDVIMCPHCGYAALGRYFTVIGASQIKKIREGICMNYIAKGEEPMATYSYEYARYRYEMAMDSAVVKEAKASETAYLSLRTGWLIRGQYEALDENMSGYTDRVMELQEEEDECLKKALDGFIKARETERFPVAGMDENTLDFIISILATRFGEYDLASQLVSRLLTSRTTSDRMKEHLLMLKETIQRTKSFQNRDIG